MRGDLKTTVQAILTIYPETRSDDFQLVYKVLCTVARKELTIEEIINGKELHLPSFESITRARRSIQAERLDLCDIETIRLRGLEEEVYEEFYSAIKFDDEDLEELLEDENLIEHLDK